MRVVIIVRGGCVQDVYATDPDCEVDLIDLDNAEADGEEAADLACDAADAAADELHHVA